ncbi:flagellar protein FlgJ, putative [Oceaniovalibus guishaninsula JLT2003]|uniref:Flagellar protein FlgJ, putative n=1 Tax=Oceaniovalibus guishaninsula JLT2003 TaxID=1231392 RepID=K2GM34_9RHOB|nr:rod-binding protein [Oceaniovalibus guishaninsula]EKE43791.1 flagellar protein FlgJ, putative [Oceaniovalibus guishaninsula JLT2003]
MNLPTIPDGSIRQPAGQSPLRAAAEALEATFLAEMLKGAGLDTAGGSFGGGIGEDQFASFLRQEQAGAMTRGGGIGLAERIFQAMGGQDDAA